MRILLFSMDLKEDAKPIYIGLAQTLSDSDGLEVFQYSLTPDSSIVSGLPQISSKTELTENKIDMILCAGGDGTMLRAALFSGDSGIPLLGINLGRLGFLAVIEKESINQLVHALREGNYTLEQRVTLKMKSDPDVFESGAFALNDFTIFKRDNSSMIRVHVMLNGEFLNTYWADGVILATPTGSTGYSLSCGGPIVFPQSGNFVLTPIAPHNLNVRPIVISDDSILEFNVEGRTDNFLCTLDSRYGLITNDHRITMSKNHFPVQLINIEGFTFLKTLRNKLMWGLDQRN
ncbi:MAG: NAD kinase [Saprospiraceae bacterium]